MTTLLPHQESALNKLMQHPAALVADETGLGKTRTAIALAIHNQIKSPTGDPMLRVLVVAPSEMLRRKWGREIEDYEPGSSVVQLEARTNMSKINFQANWFIVSYDAYKGKRGDLLNTMWFNSIIFDESHALKTPKSARTKAWRKFVDRHQGTAKVLALSATPQTNTPLDIPSQLDVIGLNSMARSIRNEVVWRDDSGFGARPVGWKDYDKVKSLLNSVAVRRKKEEVMDIAPLQHTTLPVGISTKDMHKLTRDIIGGWNIKRFSVDEIIAAGEDYDSESNPDASRLYVNALLMACGELKATQVAEYIATLTDSEKVVVFYKHKSPLRKVQELLNKANITIAAITGDTTPAARQRSADTFDEDNACRAVLCTYAAAGVGINLIAGTHVVLGELDWSPASMIQAENRIHRIGQVNKTFSHTAVAVDILNGNKVEIEHIVSGKLRAKRRTCEEVGM